MGELKPPGKPFDISKWEVQDGIHSGLLPVSDLR